MRKIVLLSVVFTLLFSVSLRAQVTFTVADGTSTNSYIPVYGLFTDAYQHTQVIYPASMLTDWEGSAFSAITFYLSSAPSLNWTSVFNVSLGSADVEIYETSAFLQSDLTTVYSGTLSAAGSDHLTIEFATPYVYTGGNLLLDITVINPANYSSAYFLGVNSSNASVYGYNMSGLSSITSAYIQSFIPKTTFEITDSCLTTSISVSEVTGSSAFVSWVPNPSGAEHSFELSYKPAEASTWTNYTGDLSGNYAMITGLLPDTSYQVRLRTFCGGGYNDLTKTFATECVGGGTSATVNIGSGTGTNSGSYLPLNTYYKYGYTQQIFKAEEISGARDIDELFVQYFYGTSYTRDVDIYLGHTAKSGFTSSSDWVPASDLTLVFSGPITFVNTGEDHWFGIPLATTFQYNGTDNLVVVFDDNTGSYSNSSEKFYTHQGSGVPSITAFSDSYNFTPEDPGTSGNRYYQRMNLRLPSNCVPTGCDRGNVVAVETSATTALLVYTPGTGSTGCEIQYGPVDGEYTSMTVNGSPHLLTGLMQNTEYKVRIRSFCNSGVSEWKETKFTTKTKNCTRLYVKADGTGDGVSWADAHHDLSWALKTAAIIKSTTGITPDIWVAEGTYYGDTTATTAFTLVDGVHVYGGFIGNEPDNYALAQRDINAHPTILDGKHARQVLNQPTNFIAATVFDGFTVRNGLCANQGGGAYMQGNMTVRNCRFVGNSAESGGGLYAHGAAANYILIEGCEFFGNSANSLGGGLYLYYAYVRHSRFSHNQGGNGGGIYLNYVTSALVEATISNCLVDNNTADYGGGIYCGTLLGIVENTTIVGNEATTSGAGLYASYMKRLANSIVWGNRRNGGVNSIETGANINFSCTNSAVEGGFVGTEVVSLLPDSLFNGSFTPKFVHPAATAGHADSTLNVDWHLQQGSVCANRGNDSLVTIPSNTDLDGNPRISHGQVDLGCYESDYEATTLPQIGNIIYVTQTGAGSHDGSSWANAQNDIQTALALAVMSNATVWVAEGIYWGDTSATSAITMMDGISVYGGFAGNEAPDFDLAQRDLAAHTTVLDGQNLRRVLYQPSTFKVRTVWDGFTIRNGRSTGTPNGGGGAYLRNNTTLQNCIVTNNYSEGYGGGIYTNQTNSNQTDSTKILNCIVTRNTASRGGGIYNYSAGCLVSHCTISYNTATEGYGGGIYAYYNVLTHCIVTHNYADYGYGGGVYETYANISNCLIANNSSRSNGGGLYCSHGEITNCTVVNNESFGNSTVGGGICCSSYDLGTQVSNCILWGNMAYDLKDNAKGDGLVITHSAVESGYPGEGNICLLPESFSNGAFYPHFANPSNAVGSSDSTLDADWHLAEGSPCANNGDNSVAGGFDLDGNPRIRHNTVDMGCYESDFATTTPIPQYGNIVYVTETGAGDNTGTSWENAIPSLNMALDIAYANGANVWVAQGTYVGDGLTGTAFLMRENVDVYGGFAGNEPETFDLSLRDFNAHPTILDGQNIERVLGQPRSFTDATAVVWDGFTIQHGGTYGDGAGAYLLSYSTLRNCIIQNNTVYCYPSDNYYFTSYGAGIYASSSRTSDYQYTTFITNCIIRNNSFENNNRLTGYGAGLYVNGAMVTHTEIAHNTFGYRGGGIHSYGYTTVSNCLIHNNSSSNMGGGVYVNGNSTFTNCDIVNNSGNSSGAGVYRYSGVPVFTNCIIWGNKRNYLPNNIYGSSGTYSYCAIEEGFSGTGNITLASTNDGTDASQYYVRFMDPANEDFRLHPTSACLNTGNNEYVTDSLDLYGNPRIFQLSVDIGCSEIQGEGDCPSVVSLTADNITTNSARLTWHPTGSENQWIVVYGIEGEQPSTVTANSATYNLTGLAFNRNYSAKVRAVCDGELMSVFSIPVNFQTTCDPTVLDTLDNFGALSPSDNATVYDKSVNFVWSSLQQATSYDIYVWLDGTAEPTIPTLSGLLQPTALLNLPNYVRGNIYHWKVVAWNECISKASPVQTIRVNPYPDLHVSAVDCSNPVAMQPMTVTWTVTNDGQGNTPPGASWDDYIWISPVDGVGGGFWYNVSEQKLATVTNLTSLNAGESYQNTATVTVPEGFMGNYYLFVFTDQPNVRDINYTPTGQSTAPNPYTPSADGNPYHYLSGTVYRPSSKIDELPGHEEDNFFYKVISVLPPPSPDLVVSSVVHGGDAISGSQANVTWTVTNQGDAAAMGSWMDVVYLSRDTILDTDEDIRLGRFTHNSPLAVGDNYQRTEPLTIPLECMGNYYIIVATDYYENVYEGLGEQNNKNISQPITVTLTWLTDLVVTSANMPASVDPNGTYVCQFTVANQGSSPTYTNSWTDAIYISQDAVFNAATAIKVGSVSHVGILNADATYDVLWNVHIPDTIQGTFHWFVVIDEGNSVFEYNAEDNNIYMYPQTVAVQLPDLQVSNIVLPETFNPNESILVRWTVRNNGPGNVVSRSFSDKFLFNGEEFYTVNVTNLSLPAGDSLTRIVHLQLPCGEGNTAQFAIQTDCGQLVIESNEGNNTLTVPMITNAPDLAISNLTIPAGDGWSGTLAEISYTITNNTPIGTSNTQVTDKFYLSNSADSYQESDLIDSYTHALNLEPHTFTNLYHTVTLPNGISGTYYYHVVCNADTAVCENGNMTNNVASSTAVSVHLSPSPDLLFTHVQVPAQAYVGAEFELVYTLRNQGNNALHNANVTQKFYYSTSSTVYDTANLLASIQDNLTLGVNDTMTLVANVKLPINASPTRYFIHAVTDANNTVYEHNGEGNNIGVSNALMAQLYSLDLALIEIEGPDVVQWGQNVTYRLHVVNNTNLATLASYWPDVLYISDDQTLQDSDPLLRSVMHHTMVDGGDGYWAEMPVTIPFGTASTAYLFGIADVRNYNPDINPLNNLLQRAITVNSVPTPDLAVDEVTVLDDVASGQPARIAYKVTNVGEIPINESSWNDKLFLSTNNTYESGDIQLLTKERSLISLAPGEFYRDTLQFTIPIPNCGSLYVLVMANANNTPFEAERSNNLAAASVNAVLPPPGDLVVRNVTCESTIQSGQMLHAAWSIQNIGDNTLTGNGLKTLVYVSSDTVFDANDRLLGSVTEAIHIPIDQEIGQNLTAKVSGLKPGEYFLIVKTDVTNAFNEANDNNNAGHSVVPFTVTIRPLPFNTDVPDTLVNDEVSNFIIEVGDNVGQTVRIRLASEDSLASAVNMIYLSYNDMGDNLNYHYSTIGQFTANTELYIPATLPGYYGLSIYGSNPSGTPQNVVVRADILPFELHAVNANHGGNTGEVTVELTGSRFRPDMTVVLRNANEEIISDTLIYVNYYQAFARFNLKGKTPGVYDVSAINFCEGEAVLPNGFTIEDGQPTEVSYNLIFPSAPRPNRSVVMLLEFGNTGNVDLHDQVLEITSLGATPISLTPEGISQNNTVLQVPLSIEGEPDGLLRPGSYGTVNIYGYTSGALMFTIKPIVEQ